MEHIRTKTGFTIAYIIAAGIMAFIIVMFLYIGIEIEADYDDTQQQLKSFYSTYDSMINGSFDADADFQHNLVVPAMLSASAIRTDGGDLEPGTFESGFILQLNGDGSGRPDGFPETEYTDREIIDTVKELGPSIFWEAKLDGWIAVDRIKGDYYYAEFIDSKDVNEEESLVNIDPTAFFSSLAEKSGYDYLMLGNYTENNEMPVFSGTGKFKDITSSGQLGVTVEEIKSGKPTYTYVNKHMYMLRSYMPENDDQRYIAVMLVRLRSIIMRALEQSGGILFLTLLIWIALSVWVISILIRVRDKKLTSDECKRYGPVSVRRKVAVCLLAGAVVVGFGSAFFESLECMFMSVANSSIRIGSYFQRIDSDSKLASQQLEANRELYDRNARRVAALLDEYRDLQNRAWLQEAAEIIDADYITIYDADGTETVSSERYKGLTLGKDESSATYDFRRLLRGVRYISHEGVYDEVTGLTRDMHGISLRFNSTDDAYGAMLIAVDPDTLDGTVSSDKSRIAASLTCDDEVLFGINPDTGDIAVTNCSEYAGMNMKEIGMENIPLTSTFMGALNVDGNVYIGRSAQYRNDDLIYYFAQTRSSIFKDTHLFAMICTVVYIILSVILALILLSGYNRKSFEKYSVIEACEEENAGSAEQKEFYKWDFFSLFNKDASPTRKAFSTAQLMVFIFIIFIAVSLFKARSMASRDDTVIEFIAQGKWEPGFNHFAIAAVLYTFCALILILAVLRFLSMLFAGFMSERNQTIWLLIINTLHYTALIVFLFVALGFLGVNTRAILTSVSLAGLALTLGAQGFIADILAGVTTVTDGTYQVGDIVEIAGFRGEVSRLGMRSTTVVGQGENVRTYRNSCIGDVTNYSRRNSWYALKLTIPSSVSLEEVESILKEELPAIGKKHSKIISGPDYRGIESIVGDKTTILILTECKQDDYNRVSRTVNRDVLELFRKHEITLL